MPESSAHDERISLRPMILGVCFFWGILCGFLFYTLKPPAARPVEPDPAPREATAPTQTPAVQDGSIPPVPKEDDLPPTTTIAEHVDSMDGSLNQIPEAPSFGPSEIAAGPPEPPLVAINPRWGLTGQNAPPPLVNATRRWADSTSRPQPPRPRERTPLPPPELEPPELEF